MTISEQILGYYKSLVFFKNLPKGILVMNPYREPEVAALCRHFYDKYYSDHSERLLMLGINPGRFGGGTTGIPFTDPIKLEKMCAIPNDLPRRTELSSDFIYRVVEVFGGPEKFYRRVLIGSVCPLGFTRGGKNLNYYDNKALACACRPLIMKSLQTLKKITGANKVICLGEGQNFKALQRINEETGLFEEIHPLPHPRFILQYRRKRVEEYVKRYLGVMQG